MHAGISDQVQGWHRSILFLLLWCSIAAFRPKCQKHLTRWQDAGQHVTVRHSTALHSIAQHCIAWHGIAGICSSSTEGKQPPWLGESKPSEINNHSASQPHSADTISSSGDGRTRDIPIRWVDATSLQFGQVFEACEVRRGYLCR